MKKIETVTGLVNALFTAYDKHITGLDWEEKITEYSDVINDFIDFDTDLDDLYMKIRQTFSNLPQPSAIKKVFTKNKVNTETKREYEHPDNGKLLVIACYKDNELKEIRDYTIWNTSTTKSIKEISTNLREKYDKITTYEYCKGSTIMIKTKKEPAEYDENGEVTKYKLVWSGDVFIPDGYDKDGHVTEYKTQRIA